MRTRVTASPWYHQKPATAATASTASTPPAAHATSRAMSRAVIGRRPAASAASAGGASSTRPYDSSRHTPSPSPPVRTAPRASAYSDAAATPANSASALVAIHSASGAVATNGAARRATSSPPAIRTVPSTAGTAAAPTAMTSAAAQPAPHSPARDRATNTSVAPGGWPATWVVHAGTSGPPTTYRVNVRRNVASPMPRIRATSCRYSYGVVSGRAIADGPATRA